MTADEIKAMIALYRDPTTPEDTKTALMRKLMWQAAHPMDDELAEEPNDE